MEFFKKYVSNTIAGSGNQKLFIMNENEIRTGRVFYKIAHSGNYNYSLLFSNITDSTYADGSFSHKNMICEPWKIIEARVARVSKDTSFENFTDEKVADEINSKIDGFKTLTFSGNVEKYVAPGEFFNSDEVEMEFDAGDYLCLEITFSGEVISCHIESILPVFVKGENSWEWNREIPFVGMVGCDRKVKARVGFLGDSITQGIGVQYNSYDHWNSVLSDKIGTENYAFWNLGIGFARAEDMATNGAWMYKAKHNDIAFVCLGANDLIQGASAEQIISNLEKVFSILQKENFEKIIWQTLPPLGYEDEKRIIWETVNDYIKSNIANKVDRVFECSKILGISEDKPHMNKYDIHPNEEGCILWAEALYEAVKDLF